MPERSLGLVVPAYQPDVDRLTAYVRACRERLSPAAVRIELDAPDAGTADALREALPGVTVAVASERRGKGAAVTAGFEALVDAVDMLAFADADGSTPPGSLAAVVAPVLEQRADLAIGSRRHPHATVIGHQTLARRRLGGPPPRPRRRPPSRRTGSRNSGRRASGGRARRRRRPGGGGRASGGR